MVNLDILASRLQQDPNSIGYIIVYGGINGKRLEAKAFAQGMRAFLTDNRGIAASRIREIDGGFREHREVEFWLAPADATATPLLTPTVVPAKVKLRGVMRKIPSEYCDF